MAAPQTITGLTLLKSGNLSYATLVVQDPNGNMATGTTEFLQNPNGILIPKRADALGTQLTTSRITSALTTTALAASATYTQGWQDAQSLAVTYAAGSVTADQAGTLIINFSDDGTTIAKTTTLLDFVPNAAGTANAQVIPYPVQIPTRYFQFAYTNGSTAQGSFALYQTPMNDWSPRDVGLTGSLALQNGTFAVTTTAQQLPTQGGSSVLLQSALANTETILFGNIGTQSMELAPGASATITVNNLNLLYVVAASGTPTLNWMVLS